MNRSFLIKLLAIVATVGIVGLVDAPYTLGAKSLLIGLLPIDPSRKAEFVYTLCKRAYPSSFSAYETCFQNYSRDSWQDALGQQKERERYTARFCQAVHEGINNRQNSFGLKFVDETRDGPLLMDTKGNTALFNRKTKVVAVMAGEFTAVDCPEN